MSGETWRHDDLAADLARYFATKKPPWLTWQNSQFSAPDCIDLDNIRWALEHERRGLGRAGRMVRGWVTCRPDVFAVRATTLVKHLSPTVFEVKVTRADFQSDVRSGKWRAYRRFCERLVFATPAGLVDKREVPEGCGLIERGARGWRMRQQPEVSKDFQPTDRFWLNLLMRWYWRPSSGIAA